MKKLGVIIKHPYRDWDWRIDICEVPDGMDGEKLKKRIESEMLGPFEVIAITDRINFNRKEKEVMEVIHGKDFNAIHCGPSRDHKCDHNGPGVMLLNDTPFEVADNPENRIKYGPLQNGASVNCSVCGRSALSNAMWEGP